MRVFRKHLITSLLAGAIAGAITAGVMTFLDWRLNPGGIFRGNEGTNWNFVADTAFSWWWPVSAAIALSVLAITLAVSWLRRGRQAQSLPSGPDR